MPSAENATAMGEPPATARDVVPITPPFFEFGPKAYLYGPALLQLARHADALSSDYGVQVIFTPQYVDIPRTADAVQRVLVFAQHMDSLRPGRGVGSVLPEALRAAGATGVLLNHSERRLNQTELAPTMRRAAEVGLATMVCADDVAQAVAIARLDPAVIIVESPAEIATGQRHDDFSSIAAINTAVWGIAPSVRLLYGAGISGPQDVYDVIAAGAQGSGSSSAVALAADPAAMLTEMIRAVRSAWDKRHEG
jgi:triosephosphate isomerase (TIM)